MKRGWLAVLPVLGLLAIYAGIAGAQGGTETTGETAADTAAKPAASSGGMQTSQRYGFSIALPSGGRVLTPEDGAAWPWPSTPSAAFHWYGGSAVKEVIVHCYEFQSPVSEGTFREFKAKLVENFQMIDKAKEEAKANDKTAQVKEAVGVKDKKSFVLGDSTSGGGINTAIEANDGSRWNLLAVKDQRKDEAAPLGYAILSTYGANRVYSITLIYSGDLTAEIKGVGSTVYNSLRDPLVTGPFGMEPIVPLIQGQTAAAAPAGRPS